MTGGIYGPSERGQYFAEDLAGFFAVRELHEPNGADVVRSAGA